MDVRRRIAAPASKVWALLVDLDAWADWGPTVRGAVLDDGGRTLTAGARGRVTTIAGVELPFRVTEFEPGRRWSWNIGPVAATSHAVEPAPVGSIVCFGVPWWATAYLPVCRAALGRIERLACDDATTG